MRRRRTAPKIATTGKTAKPRKKAAKAALLDEQFDTELKEAMPPPCGSVSSPRPTDADGGVRPPTPTPTRK